LISSSTRKKNKIITRVQSIINTRSFEHRRNGATFLPILLLKDTRNVTGVRGSKDEISASTHSA
jgi:hypothetical protein